MPSLVSACYWIFLMSKSRWLDFEVGDHGQVVAGDLGEL